MTYIRPQSIKLITTNDGSHSLLNTELDETYHSRHGARQESEYVFIEHGLNYWINCNQQNHIRILEVGLGTALNAWLTLCAPNVQALTLQYFAIEKFPLPAEVWQHLNYATTHRELFEKIHSSPWNSWQSILPTAHLFKCENSLQDCSIPDLKFDLIYYDAFAPNKQPDMWAFNVLEKVVQCLAPGAVFVTYCAKGQLKRDLKNLGLQVESLPGPPGKREMVRAIKM
ncbi:MAG TPA: tRNA (5-methylaminomethyl-2-thiouridine)(34)-methyltransferase MnmD [Cyclobacteriaceae bacterium]|jgi:tRNA U34 5-methylaminomethyl-2-thiouridine-forming methyltransferase MnmC|nr:tRNA (5-methylaminomethyl-2-thiouridine)(34)-methyltransferase MnmD [Cytophagales bacterium]HNT49695.1 tRNA (5-methylaminomethyl-2-thiouridine)(34)-methyltransferase MnmD [Cyclobacteriaceae bacterium]HRE67541.1 tRNA (5-methylaminomethyl-2-thiouridine)(34)-methyltransferase MnmD [Cyclobacteriaceae bacterium]HRF33352.1 tRNA (5-methylaminomethyl-2-thiouridine)(34)-methyltransferase MnmD [Cyclobacteriaceae bacterium]